MDTHTHMHTGADKHKYVYTYIIQSCTFSHIPLLSHSTVDGLLHFHMIAHHADKYWSNVHRTVLPTQAYCATELSPRDFNSIIWHFYLLTHILCGVFDQT